MTQIRFIYKEIVEFATSILKEYAPEPEDQYA